MEEMKKDKGDMEYKKGQTKRYPKGHFIGWGMGIGIPIGIAIGYLLGRITGNFDGVLTNGIVMGIAIGTAIGITLEKKYNEDPRPLTEAEKGVRRMLLWVAIVVLALGVVAFAIVYFFWD